MLTLLIELAVYVLLVVAVLKLVGLAIDEGALMHALRTATSLLVLMSYFLGLKGRERISRVILLHWIETSLRKFAQQASLLKPKHWHLAVVAHAVGI